MENHLAHYRMMDVETLKKVTFCVWEASGWAGDGIVLWTFFLQRVFHIKFWFLIELKLEEKI